MPNLRPLRPCAALRLEDKKDRDEKFGMQKSRMKTTRMQTSRSPNIHVKYCELKIQSKCLKLHHVKQDQKKPTLIDYIFSRKIHIYNRAYNLGYNTMCLRHFYWFYFLHCKYSRIGIETLPNFGFFIKKRSALFGTILWIDLKRHVRLIMPAARAVTFST